jgi:hypothetical protein
MYLIQILLPTYDNHERPFPTEAYEDIRDVLVEQFGGLTSYIRSPAKGLWKKNLISTVEDDIIIFEIMTADLNRDWWSEYRHKLQVRFLQEQVIIRVLNIEII